MVGRPVEPNAHLCDDGVKNKQTAKERETFNAAPSPKSLPPRSFSLQAPLLLSFLTRGYSCGCTTVDLDRFYISFRASFFFVLFFF